MRVEVSTILNCPVARVWREVGTTRLLKHITYPLAAFDPIEPRTWPEEWEPRRYLVAMRVLGVLPFGKHWINISFPLADTTPGREHYQVRDNGYGDVIRTWDHLITIRELPGGRTHYTDRVNIDAGRLTPMVWLYAQVFYRYRQHRWRGLVRSNFAYGEASPGGG